MTVTLDELNALDCDRFVEMIGWVFEHSPWVAERTWPHRPFASVDALHHAITEEMLGASAAEQLALLRAHPDLGARARMTESSTREQSGAGLDRLSRDAFDRLQRLNAAYQAKFGFPFLYAVKGSTANEILSALDARSRNTAEAEFAEALRQVSRIALFRLSETITEP